MESYGVPVIDIQEFEGSAEKMVRACEEWGCFRVVNHGIPTKLMSEMKAVAQSLFDHPVEIKKRVRDFEYGRGYRPQLPQSPFYEGFSVFDMVLSDTIDDFCDRLEASPHQREIIYKYSKVVYDLCQSMGRKLVEGTGLVGDLFNGWPCQLRVNKYHYSPQTVGLTGVPIHTDPVFLTILQDDESVNGLEVADKYSDEFVPVNHVPDTLVVITGDIAKVWSNGRFYNVKHRVQCYEPKNRFSIALFILGPKDAKVEAPSELVDYEHPRLYVPFNFGEYRIHRASVKSGTGGSLELFSATKC